MGMFQNNIDGCKKILRKAGNLGKAVVVLNRNIRPYALEVMRQALLQEDANVEVGFIEFNNEFGELFFSIKTRPASRKVSGFEQLEIFGEAADYCKNLRANTSLGEMVMATLAANFKNGCEIPFVNDIEKIDGGYRISHISLGLKFFTDKCGDKDAILFAQLLGVI